MKKINKILVIAVIICIIIVAICAGLLIKQKNKESDINIQTGNNQKDTVYSDTFKVEQIKDINKVYNLQIIANDLIENVHDNKAYPENFPYKESHIESIKDLGVEENLKKFYVESAYGVDFSSAASFYFLKGYLIIDDIKNYEGNIKKEEVKFTIQRINIEEADNYLIETYDTNSFNNIFEYDKDDFEKIKVLEIEDDSIEMYLISDSMKFKSINIDEEVPDVNLAYWYYEDYKNNKLFSDQNKEEYENTELIKYEGNTKEGFTLIDNNEKQIIIKPGIVPMEYEVEEK